MEYTHSYKGGGLVSTAGTASRCVSSASDLLFEPFWAKKCNTQKTPNDMSYVLQFCCLDQLQPWLGCAAYKVHCGICSTYHSVLCYWTQRLPLLLLLIQFWTQLIWSLYESSLIHVMIQSDSGGLKRDLQEFPTLHHSWGEKTSWNSISQSW